MLEAMPLEQAFKLTRSKKPKLEIEMGDDGEPLVGPTELDGKRMAMLLFSKLAEMDGWRMATIPVSTLKYTQKSN